MFYDDYYDESDFMIDQYGDFVLPMSDPIIVSNEDYDWLCDYLDEEYYGEDI